MKKLNSYGMGIALAAVMLLAGSEQLQADSGGAALVANVPAPGARAHVAKGDNVNVRSRPSTTAEVVAQLKKGVSVEALEMKSVTEAGKAREWMRIALPPTAKCYISAALVKDGVIVSDAVNVRCGPGTNFKDVGQLAKGDKVSVVKTEGEWVQIKPTAGCSGWVAREFFTEAPIVPDAPPVISSLPEIVPQPLPPVTAAVVTSVVVQSVTQTNVVEVEVEVLSQFLVRDGIFRRVQDEADPPAAHELLTIERDRIQFRTTYLDIAGPGLEKFEGKHVRVIGNQRWKRGDRYPVMIVERIEMVW